DQSHDHPWLSPHRNPRAWTLLCRRWTTGREKLLGKWIGAGGCRQLGRDARCRRLVESGRAGGRGGWRICNDGANGARRGKLCFPFKRQRSRYLNRGVFGRAGLQIGAKVRFSGEWIDIEAETI